MVWSRGSLFKLLAQTNMLSSMVFEGCGVRAARGFGFGALGLKLEDGFLNVKRFGLGYFWG